MVQIITRLEPEIAFLHESVPQVLGASGELGVPPAGNRRRLASFEAQLAECANQKLVHVVVNGDRGLDELHVKLVGCTAAD